MSYTKRRVSKEIALTYGIDRGITAAVAEKAVSKGDVWWRDLIENWT